MISSLYEPFKKWSDGGSIWLISDPHFNDKNTLQFDSDYLSATNPDEYINRLNDCVRKSDTLICLGDCGELKWFNDIKAGYKVLIKGNHDDKGNSRYTPYFNEVFDGALFISDKILLSHEPINGLKFCVNVHGHEHDGSLCYIDEYGGKHLNIASDVVNHVPLNLGQLIKEGVFAGLPTIHRLVIDKRDYS